MYKFVGLNDKKKTERFIATEAPRFLLTEESYAEGSTGFLEDYVKGFKTLSVTGRELLPKTILSNSFEHKHGQVFLGSKYEPRNLEFTYLLSTNTPKEFMESFDLLSRFLRQNELTFYFEDEKKYYTGTVSEVGDIEPGKTSIVSTFTVTCSDPFKYGESIVKSVNDSIKPSDYITDYLDIDVKSLKVTVNSVVDSKVKIDVGDYNLALKGLNSGDVVTVDFMNTSLYLNGVYNMNILEWNSDFENIEFNKSTVISSLGNNIEATFRALYV